MNLPFELINNILSYREPHPIAIIIKKYWINFNEIIKQNKSFCYYDTPFDVMQRISMLINEDDYSLMDRAFELQRVYSYI